MTCTSSIFVQMLSSLLDLDFSIFFTFELVIFSYIATPVVFYKLADS